MITDLETAGFDTGFTSMYWTFASGFPKAHNVSKAIDKKLGYEREIIAAHPLTAAGFFDKIDENGRRFHQSDCQGYKLYEYNGITKPRSEQAKKFDGSYAGFQPKPAAEVILVVMKPIAEKSFTDQALANGKAITWLDDCRIPYGDELPNIGDRHLHDRGDGYGFNPQYQGEPASPLEEHLKRDLELIAHEKGRFPANLIISDDILDDGRNYHSGSWCRWQNGSKTFGGSKGDSYTQWQKVQETSHGFSRFFSLDAWAEKNLPFLMVPKASKKEKEAGLDELVERIIQEDYRTQENNVPNKMRPEIRKNPHPTVKPLQLMCYLITMGSREGDIVLDPFCGSGTTCIAAMKLKRDFIGMEISAEYHEIALKRLEHFRRKKAA
jgi:site-specific DNA-methyltransferase (adenine-specific)